MEQPEFVYQSTQICRRRRPVNIQTSDERLFIKEYEREIGPINTRTLSDCLLFDSMIIGHSQGDTTSLQLVNHKSGLFRMAISMAKFSAARLQPNDRHFAGCWVVDDWSHDYFHWLTESLCKIELLRLLSLESPVLLPAAYRSFRFIEESLQILGVPFSYLSDWRISNIDRLTTVSFDFPPGNFNCHLLRRLARRFENIATEQRRPDRRIWISRSLAKRRHIVNEDALRPVLNRHGFQIVELEKYSLREQIEMLRQSSIIAGLHGAGLTNMLFMSEGSQVIEIRRRDDDHSNCYYSMASALSHDYYYLLADPFDGDVHAGDCTLEPDQLDSLLGKLN